MSRKLFSLIFLLLILPSHALSQKYSASIAKDDLFQYRRPAVTIPYVAKAPKIDGKLGPGEWNGAEPVKIAVLVGSKAPAAPLSTAWLAVDSRNLYVAYRCYLHKGEKAQANITTRDRWIDRDDAVSINIQPNVAKQKAYLFACRSNGVLHNRSANIWPDENERDLNWNAKWTAKAGTESDAWTCEIAIPLRVLEITPNGVVPIRLNLMRYCSAIGEDDRRLLTWATLIPQPIHGYQDLSSDFGVGVITFGQAKGQPINISKIKNWNGVPLFNSETSAHTIFTPAEGSAVARISLPPQALKAANVTLETSVHPIQAGEKLGKAFLSQKFRLLSPDPVRVTMSGLKSGDYQVCFKAIGPGFTEMRNHVVSVRAAQVRPEIKGDIVFEDNDWSGAAWSSGIDYTADKELLLQTQFKSPVLAFDPTEDETITCITDFQGKLYVGSCTQPAMTDTGSIFQYDPETDVWEKSFQVNDQGLATMMATKDYIYVPGYDADDGGWNLGNFYIFDGKSWVEKRTVPRAIHIYGICEYHGRVYISADILDAPPEGMTFDEANAKNLLDCYGRVVSTGDGGKTWREEYRGLDRGQDVGYMTVFNDKIVLNAHGDLVIYDGDKWTRLGLQLPELFVYDYDQVGDKLALSTQFGLYMFDGNALWQAGWSGGYTRGMAKLGDKWISASYYLDAYSGHGPGGIKCPELKDSGRPRFSAYLVAVPEPLVAERNPSNAMYEKMQWIYDTEMCTSIHSFKGRIYIGTHPEGRVLALPVAKQGFLISTPKRMETSGSFKLWWDTATPHGTSVSVQIRMASSPEELEKKPFVGPDGTVKTQFTLPGAELSVPAPCYLQYRLALKTDNPARTPYVKRVALTQ